MLYVTVSPTQRWRVVANDFTVSDSATSPASLTLLLYLRSLTMLLGDNF
ncbi:hypothetical protein E2C01_008382 [Portunus trituberculatus]|uniref:Uncharacterized protein n=1 Tax=Portunus trituberculatus TaxID=210409 RepID=A0A5B7D3W0_PORTR|nr:hypothetical protein [Portunus trituberculatus]